MRGLNLSDSADICDRARAKTEKQIPRPAKTAGIPFDLAQGKRDDRFGWLRSPRQDVNEAR